MSTQLGIKVEIQINEVQRKKTLGKAIELCAEVAGFANDKAISMELGVDKGQYSRWLSEQEGIKWEKLSLLMDVCGNDAPVLWMLYQRGYDLSSLRKRETETEQLLRIAQEKIAKLENERRIADEHMRRILVGMPAEVAV